MEGKKWLLYHDNPPAHSSLLIRDFLTKHEMTLVPQPPYSPELALADYFLFTRMKFVLKGRRFEPVEITENSLRATQCSKIRIPGMLAKLEETLETMYKK